MGKLIDGRQNKARLKRKPYKRLLQFRLPDELDDAFTKHAAKLGIDRSALARMLVAVAVDPPLAKFWTNYARTMQHLGLEANQKGSRR